MLLNIDLSRALSLTNLPGLLRWGEDFRSILTALSASNTTSNDTNCVQIALMVVFQKYLMTSVFGWRDPNTVNVARIEISMRFVCFSELEQHSQCLDQARKRLENIK